MAESFTTPSPNHSSRSGYKPEMIVIHCTDGVFPGDLERLQREGENPVSAHDLIAPNGDVYHLVPEENAAWHAGRVAVPKIKLKKRWYGTFVNPNLYTIGIEVSLKGSEQIRLQQFLTLQSRVRELCFKWNIPKDRLHVVGHNEIFAFKTCPGKIDIDKLVASL